MFIVVSRYSLQFFKWKFYSHESLCFSYIRHERAHRVNLKLFLFWEIPRGVFSNYAPTPSVSCCLIKWKCRWKMEFFYIRVVEIRWTLSSLFLHLPTIEPRCSQLSFHVTQLNDRSHLRVWLVSFLQVSFVLKIDGSVFWLFWADLRNFEKI